jgi:hypothetical protein
MALRGSWDPAHLPNLTDINGAVSSPTSRAYNCIAWAAADTTRWWWPDPNYMYFWPPNVPRETTIEAFVGVYEALGFVVCPNGDPEAGFEKVALYGRMMLGMFEPTHAARQLPDGTWTSKLGPCEDVNHATVSDVNGPAYGVAVRFLKRSKP